MSCELCEEKLLEYLYGELSEEDRLLMERHLEASASCREEFQRHQSVKETVAGPGEEIPPAGMHTRILARATEARERKASRSLRAWLFHPGLATVSVAAVAAVFYVYTLRTQSGVPRFDAPPTALKDYENAEPGKIQEYRSPMTLKDLRNPEAKDEAFLQGTPAAEEALPPPAIKKAGRREASPASSRERTAMDQAKIVVPPMGPAPAAGGNSPLESEGAASFKSLPGADALKPNPLTAGLPSPEAYDATIPAADEQQAVRVAAEASLAGTGSAAPPLGSAPAAGGDLAIKSGKADSFKSLPGADALEPQPLPAAPAAPEAYDAMLQEADQESPAGPARPLAAADQKTAVLSSEPAQVPRLENARVEPSKKVQEIPLARIETLTAANRCDEARGWIQIYLARTPEENDTGRAWMQIARCYQASGKEKEAADAAREARRIEAFTVEADAFLQTLSGPGE